METKVNSSTIYMELKNNIIRGDYPSSFALTETDLANKFGVCRNTVKKSLMMLESDGLVTLERNKGAKVKVYSIEEVLEFLEVREELECLIIRNAIKTISNEQIEKMASLLAEMKQMKESKNLLGYSNCNREFHKIIYSACTNRTAVDMVIHLKDQMKKYNNKTILVPGRDEASLSEHTKILEAFKNRDEKSAELYMRLHLRNVSNTFRDNHSLLF